MGKKDAALLIAVFRDLSYLTTLSPGWRRGICIRAFLVDRVADRRGYALVKTVRKQ
jgi:hypothetical protein